MSQMALVEDWSRRDLDRRYVYYNLRYLHSLFKGASGWLYLSCYVMNHRIILVDFEFPWYHSWSLGTYNKSNPKHQPQCKRPQKIVLIKTARRMIMIITKSNNINPEPLNNLQPPKSNPRLRHFPSPRDGPRSTFCLGTLQAGWSGIGGCRKRSRRRRRGG